MATIHWSGVSGDWSTASDWSTDTVPGPSDRAVIAAAGSYTVTVSTPEAVGSILARRFPPPWDIEEPASSSTALTAAGWYDRSRGAPGGVDDETDLAIAHICSAGARR